MLPEENAKMSDVFDPFRLLSLKGIGGIIVWHTYFIHAIPIFESLNCQMNENYKNYRSQT